MPELKRIKQLTPERLKEAIAAVQKENPNLGAISSLDTPINILNPYSFLLNLIDEKSSQDELRFGTLVLYKILSNEEDALRGFLPLDNDLVLAVRIYLKFKVQGARYTTCLHDALVCEYINKNELTELLIEDGADPDQEDDKHLSAFAKQVMQLYPASKYNTAHLPSRKLNPLQKLKKLFFYMKPKESDFFRHLISYMDLYGLFKKHPELLQVTFGEEVKRDSLLSYASSYCNAHTVNILLKEKANINFLDSYGEMPIHNAIYRSPTMDQAEIIALLLLAEWEQMTGGVASLFCYQVVDKLFSFNMTQRLREKICREFMDINSKILLKFTSEELLDAIALRFKLLKCNHILIEKKIKKSTHANIFFAKRVTMQAEEKCVVKLPFNKSPSLRSMENEIALLKQMDHPNVMKLLNILIRDNIMGYNMSYAEFGTLFHFIGTASLETLHANFYSFSLQMSKGLGYIHSLGYAHLDFTAANIFLMRKDKETYHLQIADFGAAMKLGLSKACSVTTPYVRSPELENLSTTFSTQNDIYSFGVLMGCMGSKKQIWDPIKHIAPNPPVLKQKEIYRLALWCCQFKPNERPTLLQVDEYLDQHLNHK